MVLSFGGNLVNNNCIQDQTFQIILIGFQKSYHWEDNAGGTAHKAMPAIPFKLAPAWAIQVKNVSFIDMHLIAVPQDMSNALIIIPILKPCY